MRMLLLLLALTLVAPGCERSGSGGGPAAASGSGAAATAETRVLVYGDSLWAAGGDPTRCDLCPVLPEDLLVTNYAQAGAEIWASRNCDGLDASGAPALPDPDCRNGADRALELAIDDDPAHDVCGAEVAGWPTCLADNADHDVLLLQFGTNDVRKPGGEERWAENADRYAFWLDEILVQRPAAMACVLVVPPPIWSAGYAVYNARLEDVGAMLWEAAARHGCEVADLLHLYLAIEDADGAGATLPLYSDCPARGATGGDCVHWSSPPPALPADEIADAIDRALVR